jgi:glycosyltransferase involved in cell wall biosynthesis
MNILHLTGDREDAGGILSVLRNLQEASRPWGWCHTVWVNRNFAQTRAPALNLHHSRFSCAESEQHWKLLWRALFSWPGLKRLLASEHFDIIHAHTRFALVLGLAVASRLGRRVVYTNHNYARRKDFYRRIARKPNFYTILLTPEMSRYYGIASQPPQVSIISACCADRLFEEPMVPRRSPQAPEGIIRFVGVGTIQPYKKWHLVVEALAALSEADRRRVEFSIWGPTLDHAMAQTYDKELRLAIARNQLERNIILRGSSNDINSCLRAADWFLLPSTNEPCSVALCEALALGMPALVSASGGNLDILEPGKMGLHFAPEESKDLAVKLKLILDGKATPAPPEVIRDAVRSRSATIIAEQYGKLYDRVITGQ